METIKGFGYPECKECTLTEELVISAKCTFIVALYKKAILEGSRGNLDSAKQLLKIDKMIARGVNRLPARKKFNL